jgi:hypothetical protein
MAICHLSFICEKTALYASVGLTNVVVSLRRDVLSRDSKIKRDRKKKAEQRKKNQANPTPRKPFNENDVGRLTAEMFDPLTTPKSVTEQITKFASEIGAGAPVFLECQPEPWSRQSMCDMNVEKFIEEHGGSMLCGYRVWYTHPIYVEGERHAVWVNGDEIRDVSFVDTGEIQVLFLPDAVPGKPFDDAPKKIRRAFSDVHQKALKFYEDFEAVQHILEMPPAEAWRTMLSYEQWLTGQRMPNLISKVV